MSEEENSSAADALRQAILEALGEIEACISAPTLTAADVHLARRAAKRARALARLAPPDLAALARNTRNTVDRARRALGQAREADVRAATLEALKPRLGEAHATLARLAAGEASAEARAVDLQSIREDIAALMRDWRLCETRGGLDDIIAAAGMTYRRMRKRAKAARDGESEALHRWRRTVVDFEYDAGFLAGFAPDMKATRVNADRLRRRLGEINDLDDLSSFVRERDAPEDARPAIADLEKATRARRAQLLKRAVAHAEELLEKKPRDWIRSVRRSCGR